MGSFQAPPKGIGATDYWCADEYGAADVVSGDAVRGPREACEAAAEGWGLPEDCEDLRIRVTTGETGEQSEFLVAAVRTVTYCATEVEVSTDA